MRRLVPLGSVLSLAFACGCTRELIHLQPTDETSATLRPVVDMADASTEFQLLDGFHGVEEGRWRWTKGHFSVALGLPAGMPDNPAVQFRADLSIPAVLIERLGPITLDVALGGRSLGPQTFSSEGSHVYQRTVSASAVREGGVRADFSLNHYLQPGDVDGRELGLVLNRVGLYAAAAQTKIP